tara:strand:+ start:529 stop:702 length:174 start_codon:yes stop_codon:yes gene_type:complete
MLLIKSIDLHGNRLEEANKIIEQFINKSYLENIKKLIVVRKKAYIPKIIKNPIFQKI